MKLLTILNVHINATLFAVICTNRRQLINYWRGVIFKINSNGTVWHVKYLPVMDHGFKSIIEVDWNNFEVITTIIHHSLRGQGALQGEYIGSIAAIKAVEINIFRISIGLNQGGWGKMNDVCLNEWAQFHHPRYFFYQEATIIFALFLMCRILHHQ